MNSNLYNELIKSLETGYINDSISSEIKYHPEILSNDIVSSKKILTTIEKELKDCDEFWISVAFLTMSGFASIVNVLQELEANQIKGKILVSQYLNFTQPNALKHLLNFNNIDLKIVVEGNFHSKGFLFKKNEIYDLIIGSSNLTAEALSYNKEWNLKVSAHKDSRIIKEAISEFRHEFDRAVNVNKEFIDSYEDIYNRQADINRIPNKNNKFESTKKILPNMMQKEALKNIKDLRLKRKNKALIISATGTGKTFLSAFDVKEFNPSTFLFVVHRGYIAKATMRAYKKVFGSSLDAGVYSGKKRNKNA